jgi:phosphoesterase RecJ-like protein
MTHLPLSPIINSELLQSAKQLIDSHNRFVITVHMSPDGDAVGSSLAMAGYLEAKGKHATVVYNDQPGENLAFVPGVNRAYSFDRQNRESLQVIQEADAIVCLDYNAVNRMGEMSKAIVDRHVPMLQIDHHPFPETESFDVVISHPEMCATCELLYHFIVESGDEDLIDAQIASALYTGMMTDTGMFFYNSNRPEIYVIVANLLQTGFDKEQIHRDLTMEKERRVRLKGYVLSEKLRVFYPYRAAYFSLSKAEMKRFDHQKGDSEGFVNLPLSIEGVDCSAYFREESNFIKVSLRSKGDFPVNLMAEKFFNGGGHKNAAGGEFLGSLQQAEQLFVKVLPLFAKYLIAKNETKS